MPPEHTYHFIAGLPRSGSTLLSAILRQNPRFHADISSPVCGLFANMLHTVSAAGEFSTMVSPVQRRNLLRGLVDSYYQETRGDKAVIFDTNRGWCARLPALAQVFPAAKVIACVRNVAWVMDSFERRFRADPFENTKLFNDDTERNTVYSRVDTLGQRNRAVGYAWCATKEAFYGEEAASMLVVDYDLLAAAPHKVLPLVYQFIGEPWYPHTFDKLQFDTPAFDANLGLSGLHRVRETVSLQTRVSVLPPDLFAQYANMKFWTDTANSHAYVITMQADVQ
jgi:sulfotransferase